MIEPQEDITDEEKIKIIEENKKITEENSKKFQFGNISIRLGELSNLSELFSISQNLKKKATDHLRTGISIWDNGSETEQTSVIDIGLGLRVNNIILHGFTNRNDRMCKINRYLESIEELY